MTGEAQARRQLASLAAPDSADAAGAVGDGGEALKRYWTIGEGGQRIDWFNEEGNLTRCHREVSKEVPVKDMTSDDVWGYCQNLHQRLFGVPNPPD